MKHLKKKKLIMQSLLLLLGFSLTACGNKTRIKGGQGSFGLKSVGFAQTFTDVLENNCLECHSSYDQYALTAPQADKMLEAVLSGRMPKGRSPLSDSEVATLRAWVASGAPEEAGGEAIEDEGLKPTFDSLLVNVFVPKCLSCHSGSSNAPGPVNINFSSYENLINSAKDYDKRNEASGFTLLGTAGNPESADLLFIVTDTEVGGQPMPPASLPGDSDYVNPGFLNDEEISVLTDWLNNGAPEN